MAFCKVKWQGGCGRWLVFDKIRLRIVWANQLFNSLRITSLGPQGGLNWTFVKAFQFKLVYCKNLPQADFKLVLGIVHLNTILNLPLANFKWNRSVQILRLPPCWRSLAIYKILITLFQPYLPWFCSDQTNK